MASKTTAVTVDGEMTAFDYISFTWQIPLVLTRWFFGFWAKRFSGRRVAGLHWRQLLVLTYMRAVRNTFRQRQVVFFARSPGTGPRVEKFCQRWGYELESVSVPAETTPGSGLSFPDAVLHFIKPKVIPSDGGKKTVLYFHGGGYHGPIIGNAQTPFAMDITTASKSGSLVVLEYSFTPEYPWPCQLIQAVAALRYLLTEKNISTEDIILAGDSAGGHLVISLLAHIILPSPYAPSIGENLPPFRAALMISPWVSMRGAEASVLANEEDDYLNLRRLKEFVHFLQAPEPWDVYFDPWEAQDAKKAVWDKGFPWVGVARKTLVTIGTTEILLDSTVAFAGDMLGCDKVLIDGKKDVEVVAGRDAVLAVVAGEGHVQPGLDNGVRYKGGLMNRAVMKFLETV